MHLNEAFTQHLPGSSKTVVIPMLNLTGSSKNAIPDDTDFLGKYVFGIGIPALNWGVSYTTRANGVASPLISLPLAELLDNSLTLQDTRKRLAIDDIPMGQLLATGTNGSFSRPSLVIFQEPMVLSLTNCELTYNNGAAAMTPNRGVPLVLFYASPREGEAYIKASRARQAVLLAAGDKDPAVAKWITELNQR